MLIFDFFLVSYSYMTTTQIVLQIIPLILQILAIFQKEKWNMLLIFTISNLIFVAVYFAYSRTATACICIVAAIRTITYMIFSLKKIKPNWIILIIFELAFIFIS